MSLCAPCPAEGVLNLYWWHACLRPCAPAPPLSPQSVLNLYARELVARLPKTVTGQTSVTPTFNNNEWHIRMSEQDEKV